MAPERDPEDKAAELAQVNLIRMEAAVMRDICDRLLARADDYEAAIRLPSLRDLAEEAAIDVEQNAAS